MIAGPDFLTVQTVEVFDIVSCGTPPAVAAGVLIKTVLALICGFAVSAGATNTADRDDNFDTAHVEETVDALSRRSRKWWCRILDER